MSILIKNGYVVKEDCMEKCDVLVEGRRIVAIEPNIDGYADKVIDAENLTVMAGFVDMHCHLREPGFEYKEDIASGTKSALQGGFTSIACMPNTSPVIDNTALVLYVKNRAAEEDNAKVYPIAAVTKGQKGKELTEMGSMKQAGAVAFSDDGLPVADGNTMRLALEYAKTFDALVISHCEDKAIAGEGVVNEGFNATIAGLKGINRVAEEAMVARDILLAESLNTKVHIAHVSTRGSVDLVRWAKARGVKVTCETCPHYFSATDDEILSFNTYAKINPPLREADDVIAIIEGIKDGTIDAIATDHAPHHIDEKNREFNYAPNGSIGFETAFAIGYTYLVEPGHIDLTDLSRLMSKNPSEILGIGSGKLAVGETADITIVDLNKTYEVDKNKFVSKAENCVFNGWKVTGTIEHVIIDGQEKEIKHYDR